MGHRKHFASIITASTATALVAVFTACAPLLEPSDEPSGVSTDTTLAVPRAAQTVNAQAGNAQSGSGEGVDEPTGATPGDNPDSPIDEPPSPGTNGSDPSTSDNNSGSYIAKGARMGIGGCPLYPDNNVFHADITSLPTHPDSDAIIAEMDNAGVRGLSSSVWNGSRGGYPVNVVDSRVDKMTTIVTQGFLLQPESLGSFPMPPNPRVEGDPTPAWDQHLLLFDVATCRSHEFSVVRPPNLSFYGKWEADSAYTLDLTSNVIPKKSSTVSTFSLLAGLIRYDEVASGSINHAISGGIPNTSTSPGVWPARPKTDGTNNARYAPKIGSWLRLKNVDMNSFGPQAQVIVRALQKHGLLVKDTNLGGVNLNGENDPRWNNDDMRTLRQLTSSDFEIVDPTSMMISPDSYEIR